VPEVLRTTGARLGLWNRRRTRAATPPELDQFLYGAEVFDALTAMTGGRCAFCERRIAVDGYASRSLGASVTHYRPPWGAVDHAGAVSMDHYWWLAYTWENLLPACADCIRAKGNRFPIERAERASRREPLDRERPYLLDPTTDDPEPHLIFQPDGTVVGATQRGATTVEALALNRSSLVSARRSAAKERGKPGPADEFQALRRQLGALPKRAQPTAAPLARDHYDLESAGPLGEAEKSNYFSTVRCGRAGRRASASHAPLAVLPGARDVVAHAGRSAAGAGDLRRARRARRTSAPTPTAPTPSSAAT
jgi:uncharacterized protein (TIGR02646 family)